MPSGKKKKRHKMSTHKRKKRLSSKTKAWWNSKAKEETFPSLWATCIWDVSRN